MYAMISGIVSSCLQSDKISSIKNVGDNECSTSSPLFPEAKVEELSVEKNDNDDIHCAGKWGAEKAWSDIFFALCRQLLEKSQKLFHSEKGSSTKPSVPVKDKIDYYQLMNVTIKFQQFHSNKKLKMNNVVNRILSVFMTLIIFNRIKEFVWLYLSVFLCAFFPSEAEYCTYYWAVFIRSFAGFGFAFLDGILSVGSKFAVELIENIALLF